MRFATVVGAGDLAVIGSAFEALRCWSLFAHLISPGREGDDGTPW